jgi:hypothetical protein
MTTLALAGCGGGGGSAPAPSFTLALSPANPSVGQGGTATSVITVRGQDGFTGSVSLSVAGLPSGVTASFNPTNTTSTSTLTLAASNTATLGDAIVTTTGMSGNLSQIASIDLTVALPTVKVSLSPQMAAVVVTTQAQQFTPTVAGNTSNLGVTWSVDGTVGGNASTGTISVSGLYTPPAAAGTHSITATSVANSADAGSASVAVTDLAGVFTHHDDLSRDGTNTQEYALTPNNVNPTAFGKLFSCATATPTEAQAGQGAVFTQTLWVPSLNINGGTHDVIFVATQHDTVFAFDADANPCVQYWQVNLLDTPHGGTSGEMPVFWNNVGYGYGDIYPEVGVTGTPVIDPATNTIYMVSTSQNSSQGTFYQRLHALDLGSGNEKFSAPVNIAASALGNGDGSSGGILSFSAQMENQRPALALAGGTVYIGWSAHEDASPWHGWFIGYSASNVQQQVSVFNTTPNGGAGGVWAGGGAPAVDGEGNIYISTGNGLFDANQNGMPDDDYGDSLLKLIPFTGSTSNGENLNLVDWFTPDDQSCLASTDTDLGSGNVVLLPDQTTGPILHLLVQMGKEGVVYLINRDNMGHFQSSDCQGSNGQIVQTFVGSPSGFYGTPAFWQNTLYFAGSLDNTGYGDYLKLFSFNPSTGQFDTAPASQSAHYFNFPGASPSISSQGASNGIIWAIDASAYGFANPNANGGNTNCSQVPLPSGCAGPAVLYAYDAGNLMVEYWDSTIAPNGRDRAGNAVKFVPPTVANGKVYVSTRTEVDVYGLFP